jgi:plastocyanin domain-containing protein
MFLIYDARTAEGYEEGFQECLSIISKSITSQLKSVPLTSYENALSVINNIILQTQQLQLLFNKGE